MEVKKNEQELQKARKVIIIHRVLQHKENMCINERRSQIASNQLLLLLFFFSRCRCTVRNIS